MTDLEHLFQDAVAFAEDGHPPPGDPLARLSAARSSLRRRWWAAVAVPAAAAAAVVAVVVPTVLLQDDVRDTVASNSAPTLPEASPRPTPVPQLTRVPTRVVEASPNADGSCTYRTAPESNVIRPVEPPPPFPTDLPRTATIHTNRGDVALTFADTAAVTPCTVHSFAHLVRNGFYDDTPCHRLTTQGIYVLQCGDPAGKGTGGPGYVFADENLRGTTYKTGAVGMANSGPGTSGSQFFLVYQDTQLDPNYTVWAHITAGLDVVRAIAEAGSVPDGDGRPKLPVQILSITLR